MNTDTVRSPSRFSDRILRFLERVEHRPAQTAAEKEAIYRLRYEAYLRENFIVPTAERMRGAHAQRPVRGSPPGGRVGLDELHVQVAARDRPR